MGAGQGAFERGRIEHVAVPDLRSLTGRGLPGAGRSGIARQDANGVSRPMKPPEDFLADKSGRAGDKHMHGFECGVSGPS